MNRPMTLCGIDGGTDRLGLATLYVDPVRLTPLLLQSTTLVASQQPRCPHHVSVWGDRRARIEVLSSLVSAHFDSVEADLVGMEDAFFNPRRPSAYAPLIEVIDAMKTCAYRNRPDRPLFLIDAPAVKNAVGAPGNAAKEQVKDRLMSHPEIRPILDVAAMNWDEHSVDAAAVVWALYTAWRRKMTVFYPTGAMVAP